MAITACSEQQNRKPVRASETTEKTELSTQTIAINEEASPIKTNEVATDSGQIEQPIPVAPAQEPETKEETQEQADANAKNDAIKELDSPFADPDSQSRQPYPDLLSNILNANPVIDYQSATNPEEQKQIQETCQKISNKLASVSLKECMASNLRLTSFESALGTPILLTEFPELTSRRPLAKILVIGGTHGDELTSISVVFKWIDILKRYHSGLFHWHIAPVMNPDGALIRSATRPNANGVDLNRNLPTPDWHKQSLERWKKIQRDPRKNPGIKPASEPEVRWLMHEIASFKPDAIVSVHAPYGILDFDSGDLTDAPKKFGRLQLNLLGTYPGSLGNYAGIDRNIPVLTLELPHASVMPKPYEVNSIWSDMIRWLKGQFSEE